MALNRSWNKVYPPLFEHTRILYVHTCRGYSFFSFLSISIGCYTTSIGYCQIKELSTPSLDLLIVSNYNDPRLENINNKKYMKLTKVFFGEKRLKDMYVGASRFQVFKYRLSRFVRRLIIASFLLGAVFGAYKLGNFTTEPVGLYAATKEVDVSDIRYQTKIDKLKDDVVEKLASCESAGYTEDDGIIIFDSNEKASIGSFQWQIASVKHYHKLMTGKDVTSKEAILIALDKTKAKGLARYVAFETKNKMGKDWINCEKKFGLDAQIDIIKKLEL